MRGPSGQGASRLARAGVLESTSSTASKRNEVMAVVSRAAAVKVVRNAGQIDLPSPLGARTKEKSLPASHPGPREEKSGEKNRGGDITPMRLRRSLFFVAPATPAGRPSRRQPGETVQALPGRSGCGLPGAPKRPQAAAPEARSSCRTKLHTMRGRCGRTSFGPGASRARLGRKSGVCMAVLFAVGAKGSHNQKPPPGPPRRPPSQCFPAHFCPELPGIARQKILPLSKCPRTVRRSRSALRRAPFAAAPVALRAPSAAANAK